MRFALAMLGSGVAVGVLAAWCAGDILDAPYYTAIFCLVAFGTLGVFELWRWAL